MLLQQLKANIKKIDEIISTPHHPLLKDVKIAKQSYRYALKKLILDVLLKDI